MIQTDNQTDTRILRFTVLDANAKEAKKIANELADVTAERVAYVMSSDKPKVVEEAVVPKYPSSPNTKKNTAMGGLAFAFVAATVIVLRYLMNDTIQTEEDIKNILDFICLQRFRQKRGNRFERQDKKDYCCGVACDSSLLCRLSDLVLRHGGKDEAVV